MDNHEENENEPAQSTLDRGRPTRPRVAERQAARCVPCPAAEDSSGVLWPPAAVPPSQTFVNGTMRAKVQRGSWRQRVVELTCSASSSADVM